MDAALYRHVAERFDREVKAFGRKRMERSVQELRRITEKARRGHPLVGVL